ncbi:MAG: hypothetical protein ACRC9X_05515 [Bacteroidales bacterium]
MKHILLLLPLLSLCLIHARAHQRKNPTSQMIEQLHAENICSKNNKKPSPKFIQNYQLYLLNNTYYVKGFLYTSAQFKPDILTNYHATINTKIDSLHYSIQIPICEIKNLLKENSIINFEIAKKVSAKKMSSPH